MRSHLQFKLSKAQICKMSSISPGHLVSGGKYTPEYMQPFLSGKLIIIQFLVFIVVSCVAVF